MQIGVIHMQDVITQMQIDFQTMNARLDRIETSQTKVEKVIFGLDHNAGLCGIVQKHEGHIIALWVVFGGVVVSAVGGLIVSVL